MDTLISDGIEGKFTPIHKLDCRSNISDTGGGNSGLFYILEKLHVGVFAVFRSLKPLYRIFSEGRGQWNYISNSKLFCMA